LNFVNVESDVCSTPPKRDKQGVNPAKLTRGYAHYFQRT
jgi:hypothetical protein